MVEVMFSRLLEMAEIDKNEICSWIDVPSISLDEVVAKREQGLAGNAEPYGDTWKHPILVQRNTEYHISRIIYFVDHPDEVSEIEVDNPCFDDGILPGCEIIDGWHRIAAGIILGLQTVAIQYGGRSDVEDYICGKIDEKPDDILFLNYSLY